MRRALQLRKTQPGTRAFTLVEVLVALVLAAIVTAGVALAVRTGLDAAARVNERSDAHSEARGALEILESDLGSAFLSGANTAETLFVAQPPESTSGDAPFLTFTTLNSRRHPDPNGAQRGRADQLRVDYLLQSPPDGDTGMKRLLRRERWLTESGPGETSVLCEHVVGLQLGYSGGSGMKESWSAARRKDPPLSVPADEEEKAVKTSRTLPRAVDVTLLLASPSADPDKLPPRAYHTLVLLQSDGVPPFETEVQPPKDQSAGNPGQAGQGGGPPGGGQGGGGSGGGPGRIPRGRERAR